VESHQPTKLFAHLKKDRGWAVEKRSAGIYIVTGDIVRIQIIDSRELSEAENLWLKTLKEVYEMSKSTLTLDQVLIDVGLAAKWEAKARAEYSLKIAKNLLADGLSPERVAKNADLPLAKVKALLKNPAKKKLSA
jgi:hypothetical protein